MQFLPKSIVYMNNCMKAKTLLPTRFVNEFTQYNRPPIAKWKESLSSYVLPFYGNIFLYPKQIHFRGINYGLSSKPLCFSKSYISVKFSKMFSQQHKIIKLRTCTLVLNLSRISNKAPNLYSLICSEMNTVLFTNIRLL